MFLCNEFPFFDVEESIFLYGNLFYKRWESKQRLRCEAVSARCLLTPDQYSLAQCYFFINLRILFILSVN